MRSNGGGTTVVVAPPVYGGFGMPFFMPSPFGFGMGLGLGSALFQLMLFGIVCSFILNVVNEAKNKATGGKDEDAW